jgi:hypothetical protein
MFVLTKKKFDKNLRGAIKHTLLLFVFLSFFFLQESFAQAPGMLEFSGKAVKDNKPLAGAVVTVYRNGTVQQEQLKTGKNGKFRLYLVFGVDYKITFSYPGCVDMYLLVYTGKVSKERSDLFPLYQTEIPFFETTTSAIRLSKFKNPFTKIVFDGKKAFKDDDAYLADFTKDVLITSSEQATLLAEKKAKEKEEKDKLEAELKAKKEAEEKAKNDLEEKLLAEQKAREEALVKAAELARLKRESENQQQNENQSMETEAIRLQKEKEAKALLAKKNKEIKTNYENDLLKMVAENERTAKQKDFSKNKQQARANTVIEQMRRENDLKGKADKLIEEQKLKKKQLLANQQYKQVQMRKLVEAAAFAERSVRIGNQKSLPDTKDYKTKPQPNVLVTIDDGVFTTIRTTVVTQGKRLDTYRKETFFWGAVHCYKNEIEIPQTQYNVEIAYYLSYMNK